MWTDFHLMFGQMIIFGCKPLNLEQDLFPVPWVVLNVFFSEQHHMFFFNNFLMVMTVMMMMMAMIDGDMLHLSSPWMAPRVSLAPFVTLRPICASLAP